MPFIHKATEEEQVRLQGASDGEERLLETAIVEAKSRRRVVALGAASVAAVLATAAVSYGGRQLRGTETKAVAKKFAADMHCFAAVASDGGIVAQYQGEEIGKTKFNDKKTWDDKHPFNEASQTCIDQCNEMEDCMSFTQCDGWNLCFFKDKVLTNSEPMQEIGNECRSIKIVNCPGMDFPQDVAEIEDKQQEEIRQKKAAAAAALAARHPEIGAMNTPFGGATGGTAFDGTAGALGGLTTMGQPQPLGGLPGMAPPPGGLAPLPLGNLGANPPPPAGLFMGGAPPAGLQLGGAGAGGAGALQGMVGGAGALQGPPPPQGGDAAPPPSTGGLSLGFGAPPAAGANGQPQMPSQFQGNLPPAGDALANALGGAGAGAGR